MKKLTSVILLGLAMSTSAFAASLPETPVPFKSGAGVINDGVIYFGLGTAGKDWYKLDVNAKEPKWEKIAAFTGTARDQSQAVVLNDKNYVFGGVGKATEDATRISVLNDVYCYDIKNDAWEKVMTRAPRGMTGHAVATIDNKSAFVVGSVNKPIFDGFFEDLEAAGDNKDLAAEINAAYISKSVADYFFNNDVLKYDAASNSWSFAGQMPTSGTAGSALAVDGDSITIINGERKPGLRTAAVNRFIDHKDYIEWQQLPDLIPPVGADTQEGVAGAFAGVSAHTIVVAGGANFPGSTKAYAQGKNFAHQGCTKTWRDEIYAYADGRWVNAGKLPLPLGYGVTVQNGDEIILIGGETTGGKATTQVITMSIKDGKVLVEK